MAWSPDGSRIACIRRNEFRGKTNWVIRIFRVADGEELAVIEADLSFRWVTSISHGFSDGDNFAC